MSQRKNNLYYLLPGQARGARKRFVRNLVWSVIIGLLVSGLLGGALYLINRP